jgi:hypothetical protein
MKLITHLQSSTEAMNVWCYTSTPPYDFRVWCSIEHRDKYTFTTFNAYLLYVLIHSHWDVPESVSFKSITFVCACVTDSLNTRNPGNPKPGYVSWHGEEGLGALLQTDSAHFQLIQE